MADQLITGTTLIEEKRSATGLVLSIHGAQFTTGNPDIDDISISDNAIQATGSGIRFLAHINLPNGAKITEIIVYGNVGAQAETWELRRAGRAAELSTMATANIGTADTSISTPVVNNVYFIYLIEN